MKSNTIRKFSGGVLLAVGLAAGVASAQTAGEGTFNGSSYKVVKSAEISWIAAKDAAAGMSSTTEPVQACYLATITSQAENEFIEDLRLAHPAFRRARFRSAAFRIRRILLPVRIGSGSTTKGQYRART